MYVVTLLISMKQNIMQHQQLRKSNLKVIQPFHAIGLILKYLAVMGRGNLFTTISTLSSFPLNTFISFRFYKLFCSQLIKQVIFYKIYKKLITVSFNNACKLEIK